ncbi:AraC family transcriptional regulator [Plantactinospora sp. WMMC1484]|uniref:AraC family transcriptional regulator n=1 Tax=Plantactinospora sp. WMMC1484 TaxID=3404122 RepID=UPI003BF48CC2
MDVLSDVIAVMRTGRPRSARLAWQAPWAQHFGPVPGAAGFQVILRGPCWLIRPETEPVPLGAGDVLFLSHGRGHTLADSPSTRPTGPGCDPTDLRSRARYAISPAVVSPAVGRVTDRAAAFASVPAVDVPAVDVPAVGVPAVGVPAVGGGVPAAEASVGVTVTLCGAYELDPAGTHPLLAALPDLIHLPAHLGRYPELRSTVDLLAAELASPRLGTDAIVPALLDTLLLYTLRAWYDRAPQPGDGPGWAAALRDPVTGAALRAIHRDPAHPWTVAALAAEAGLSRAPFARRFTALLGQPPLAYLTWWRMTTAARLLRESDTPLTTIAGRVGYASEFALGAAFKRRYGIAPGRYRRTRSRHGESPEHRHVGTLPTTHPGRPLPPHPS